MVNKQFTLRNEVISLPRFTVTLDDTTARFYERVGQSAGLPTEQVLSDALFKLAAELSLEALAKKKPRSPTS